MKFDPATGEPKPYPSHSEQWRKWHGYATAWLFNPWTGGRRSAGDVGTDVLGRLIQPPTELSAAQSAQCGNAGAQMVMPQGGSDIRSEGVMTDNDREFLLKLADLMEAHKASLSYTRDDDGIHIDLDGLEVFVGWLRDDAPSELRAAAKG